jgi:hypothetical protein
VNSFHTALLVCAAFAALGIFTALARGKGSSKKGQHEGLTRAIDGHVGFCHWRSPKMAR